MRKYITPTFAGAGWILNIILFTQLLSGTFDTRSCTTACVQTLYWGTFVVAVAGWLYGVAYVTRVRDVVTIISLTALTVLVAKLVGMMVIGTFL